MHSGQPATLRSRPAYGAASLTLRVLSVLAVAVGASALSYRAATLLLSDTGAAPWLVAAGVGATLAAGLVAAIVAPLVRTRTELEVRYAAALADALTDQLTGLGNHRAFQEELDRQVEASRRYETPLALVLLDVDEFKTVNDGGGHAAGDRVLRGLGQLLPAGVRRADRCFRIGGDEFAILLPMTDAEGARTTVRRLLALALQPAFREPPMPPISFSAGISATPELADSRSRLYSQADAALYAAKRGGRTDVVVFDPAEETGTSDASTSADVAEVIARGQLRAVYQPIVSLGNGAVLGVEGLIRPTSETRFADPVSLFAAAEAS